MGTRGRRPPDFSHEKKIKRLPLPDQAARASSAPQKRHCSRAWIPPVRSMTCLPAAALIFSAVCRCWQGPARAYISPAQALVQMPVYEAGVRTRGDPSVASLLDKNSTPTVY